MSKIVIIGSGPAGISASLYTMRAGIDTMVISKENSSLKMADKIENYYGVGSISGQELEKTGLNNAKNLGVKFASEEVVDLIFENNLIVKTDKNEYSADAVIIAAGASRNKPKIKNLNKFEGKGVSCCAVCDGFFYKGKDVAVIGSGEYALNEIKELLPLAKSVTLLTNGEKLTAVPPTEVKIVTKKISLLNGESALDYVEFEDGEKLNIAGLFLAVGIAGSTDLAKKIGIITENNKIVINENASTNIPSIFAAGDCTGGMMQIAKAVYEGALAGTNAVKYIRSLNKKSALS